MAASTSQCLAVVVSTETAQKVRRMLEKDELWDSSRRLSKLDDDLIAIPVKSHFASKLEYEENPSSNSVWGRYHQIACRLAAMPLPPSRRRQTHSPGQKLAADLQTRFQELAVPFPAGLEREIPNAWERHGDLILLPQTCFQSAQWSQCTDLWPLVARILGGQRVARKGRVKSDDYRSPRVELLLGNDGWVDHKDNGVRYTYDITQCMFSVGNITEKLRVASFDCTGETVVDLYAGIGYFTLPYLVHAKAALVHACEWNPAAAAALRRNLVLNGVQDRCVVHVGDNRKVSPRGVADRVNLGLIPSSEAVWPVACAALNPRRGGTLHVHGNVTSSGPLRSREEQAKEALAMSDREHGGLETGRSAEGVASRLGLVTRGLCDPAADFADDFHPEVVSSGNCKMAPGEISKEVSHRNGEVVSGSARLTPQGSTGRDTPELVPNTEGGSKDKPWLVPRDYWNIWASHTALKLHGMLVDVHGGVWTTEVAHVEHVKSYAPRVDHVVVDIECTPR